MRGVLIMRYPMLKSEINLIPPRKTAKPKGYWLNEENIKKFLENLKSILKLNTFEDWNKVTKKEIQINGGNTILKRYSLYELKCLGFPEGKEKFNKKQHFPSEYWNKENINQFINELKENYNLVTFDDWSKITKRKIKLLESGNNLLKVYSLHEIKTFGCPNLNEKQIKPKGFWKKKENVENFLQKLKEKFNFTSVEDWDKLTQNQIIDCGGNGLVKQSSMYKIKCLACPEGKSHFKKEKKYKPPGFWDNKDNIEKYLEDLKVKLNINTIQDWNSIITKQKIQYYDGGSLLRKYSMLELKSLAFPNEKSPRMNNFTDKDQILEFINYVKEKLNLNTPEDWNALTKKQIRSFGGNNLLKKYSLFDIKCLGCPEVKLIFAAQSKNLPKAKGYWDKQENIDSFFDNLQKNLNICTIDDWKRVSQNQIRSNGGRGLLSKYSKEKLINERIQSLFNENKSSINKLNAKPSQRWLFLQIQKIFPGEEIVEDYYHSEISRQSGFPVQFDVYLVDRKIAFEYQGEQHYEDIPSTFSPIEIYQHRDFEKQNLCNQFGIQLISIPYWWDKTLYSLQKTIDDKLLDNASK